MKGRKTLLGLAMVFVPWVDHLYQYMNALPDGVLPPQASIIIQGLGAFLALYGRMVAKGPLV